MPVPGSLKRRPINDNEIAELLSSQFALPKEETLVYLKLLETNDLTIDQLSLALDLSQDRVNALVGTMITRGLIIRSTGSPERYSPLHPRMTLTNIFKIYEKELVQALRDRRATVDRVVNMLIPIYEEREMKNSVKRGASSSVP